MKIKKLKKSLIKSLFGLILISILVRVTGNAYISRMDNYKQLFRLDNYVKNSEDIMEYTGYNYPYKNVVLDVFGDNMKSILSGSQFNDEFNNNLANYIANIKGLVGGHGYEGLVNGEGWERYYNEANFKLLEGYDNLKSDKQDDFVQSYTNFLDSIQLFNDAAYLLGTGDETLENYIINNRVTAYYLKYLAGVKICIDSFRQALERVSQIIDLSYDLTRIFDKEIEEIKRVMKESDDTDIRKCMRDFYKSANESKIGVEQFQILLEGLMNDAIEKLRGYMEDPDICVTERKEFLVGILDSANAIDSVLRQYMKSHNQLYKILEYDDMQIIRMLCEQKEKLEEKENKMNEQLQESLQKLKDLMQQGDQPQPRPQQGEEPKEGSDQGKASGENEKEVENKGANNEKQHYYIPEGYEERALEKIEKQNKKWIEDMNKLKSREGYNPKNLLDQLFKDFYGNDEDFDKAAEEAGQGQGPGER